MRVVHVVSSDLAPAHAARVRAFIRRLDGEGALSCAEMPPVRSGGRRATTRARLIDRLWSLEPDIVHVHGRGAGASVMPAASWLCAPVVLSPAPCDCRRAPDPLRRMLRARSWSRLVRGCAGLIFTSDGARAAWFEAGGSDACGIVGVCAVPLVAAVLAPLNAEVDAASRAVDEDRDQRLIAVGCRPDSPLGRMLRDAGVRLAADGFRIAPATDPRVARRAGVFVAPDVGEGDLGPLSTAMAAGVPVIARADSAAAALLAGSRAGIVVGGRRPDIAREIGVLARAGERLPREAAARALAIRLFGEARAIATHLDLYEQVLARAAGGIGTSPLMAGSAPPRMMPTF